MLKVAWKFVKEWEPSNRPSSFFFSLSSRSIEDERRLKGTFTGSSKPVPPNFLVTSTVNSGSGGDLFAFEFHSRSILHGRRKRKKKRRKRSVDVVVVVVVIALFEMRSSIESRHGVQWPRSTRIYRRGR